MTPSKLNQYVEWVCDPFWDRPWENTTSIEDLCELSHISVLSDTFDLAYEGTEKHGTRSEKRT